MKKILILLLPLFLVTGCYNYQELNKLGIITATEIDKINDEFVITVQIVNPKKQTDASSSNQPAFITYSSTGRTVHEAYRNLIQKTSRKIYGTHMQILIIKENLARNDLKSIFDFYFRNIEIRKEFYVLVDTTKNEDLPENKSLLDILTPLTNLSSQNIVDTLLSDNKYISVSNLVTFNELMDSYLDEHKEILLPTIMVCGDIDYGNEKENLGKTNSTTDIEIGNMAIFKDNKMIGILSKDESITSNLINNTAKEILMNFKCDNEKYASAKVIISKTDVKINEKEYSVDIKIKGVADLTEYSCNDDLDSTKVVSETNDKLNEHFVNTIKDNIKNINELYNSDIYGFRDMVYKKKLSFYNTIKDDYYKNFFDKLSYNVTAEIRLVSKGNLNGGTYENDKD